MSLKTSKYNAHVRGDSSSDTRQGQMSLMFALTKPGANLEHKRRGLQRDPKYLISLAPQLSKNSEDPAWSTDDLLTLPNHWVMEQPSDT